MPGALPGDDCLRQVINNWLGEGEVMMKVICV